MPPKRVFLVVRLRRALIGGVMGAGLWAGMSYLLMHTDVMENVQNIIHGPPRPGAEARRIEQEIAAHPNDLALRVQALKYYSETQFDDRWAKQARRSHILWLIRHHPETEIAGQPDAQLIEQMNASAYAQAKQLWLHQVRSHPADIQVLSNAASFFTLNDLNEAEALLKIAQSREPANARWHSRLGQLYGLKAMDIGGWRRGESVRKSLAEQETALALTPVGDRADLLPDLAKMAYDAEAWPQAKRYALEAIQVSSQDKQNLGVCVHDGNMVLGRLALRSGDVREARRYLLAAGATPGAPTLDSFGPNMGLANDMLQRGERDTVLQYFALCGHFWHDSRLAEWKQTVQRGGAPDFGANLNY